MIQRLLWFMLFLHSGTVEGIVDYKMLRVCLDTSRKAVQLYLMSRFCTLYKSQPIQIIEEDTNGLELVLVGIPVAEFWANEAC